MEHRRPLAGRVALREQLEAVPYHGVAAARLVDREVRLEHAALRPEGLDGVLVPAPGGVGERLAGRRGRAVLPAVAVDVHVDARSEEHTSELQSLMRISYAVFCLKKKNTKN